MRVVPHTDVSQQPFSSPVFLRDCHEPTPMLKLDGGILGPLVDTLGYLLDCRFSRGRRPVISV
jgi:hypothetical protein